MTVLARFAQNRPAVVGAVLLLAMAALAAVAPALYPHGMCAVAGPANVPPGGSFLLGTDTHGRDVAAGILYGARTSLLVGAAATASALAFGCLLGAMAGLSRGPADLVLMRLAEFFQIIPSFMLAILLVVILSPSVLNDSLAIALVSWPAIARLVRCEVAALASRDFVLATTGLGAGPGRILAGHILPNCASTIVSVASMLGAGSILFEAGLSYLGLGDPNRMSWGLMISNGHDVLRSAWWISTFPGLAIAVTVLAINLVGDGLNEALKPRPGRR